MNALTGRLGILAPMPQPVKQGKVQGAPCAHGVRGARVVARAANWLNTGYIADLRTKSAPIAVSDVYKALRGCEVYVPAQSGLARRGERVELVRQWGDDDVVVLAFGRSFGCLLCWELATQLARDVKPRLDDAGVKLFFVGIGTPERAVDFTRETKFPAENLFADPDAKCYSALELKKGVVETFFSPTTPYSFLDRMRKGSEGLADLKDILKRWIPGGMWIPPKRGQALNQGGMFVFKGKQTLFAHYDPSTGAHADIQEVMQLALAAKRG